MGARNLLQSRLMRHEHTYSSLPLFRFSNVLIYLREVGVS